MSGTTKHFAWPFSGTPRVRLDRFLQDAATASGLELSRAQIQNRIVAGDVAIDGVVSRRPGALLKHAAVVSLEIPEAAPSELPTYDLALEVLLEEDEFLVINKPPGLSVHPGAGNRSTTLVNVLLGRYKLDRDAFPDASRPGIVHRLDKDTSGALVIAKSAAVHRLLSAQFASKVARRRYLALAYVPPKSRSSIALADHGEIAHRIGRHPTKRQEMAVVREGGRTALTRWWAKERMQYATLLDIELLTGRTHQIRVHLAAERAPILGDPVYHGVQALPTQLRARVEEFGRQALHAYQLSFTHPRTGADISVSASPPPDFIALIGEFRR